MVKKKKSSKKKSVKRTVKTKKKKTPKKKTTKRGGTTTKRKTSKKGRTTKVRYESTKEIKVDKILVDNFIALQRVMVNLSSKFDDLSKQISKLLDLFEISAKSLAQKDSQEGKLSRKDEKILQRLDDISQHAGLIGKGLALIHDINKEEGKPGLPTMGKNTPRPAQGPQMNQRSRSNPFPTQQKQMPKPQMRGKPQMRQESRGPPQQGQREGMQGYQKSISSNTEESA